MITVHSGDPLRSMGLWFKFMLHLVPYFVGGIATSRLSLRFAVLHMVAYPDIQKKVQEEIDRVVGKDQ